MIVLQKVVLSHNDDFSLQGYVPEFAGSISDQDPYSEMLLYNPGCMGEQQMPTKLQMHLRPARDFTKLQLYKLFLCCNSCNNVERIIPLFASITGTLRLYEKPDTSWKPAF
jgi:hypothetical protein